MSNAPSRGATFRVAVFHAFGAFGLRGEDVQMWLETRPRGERSSLRELVEGIRRLPRARVSWEARVVSPPHGASKVVHVDFIARNEGTEGIPVIPPSYFGDSVHAYPLEADGL